MLKLWVRFGSTEEEYRLAHKRVVELFDLAYLGPFVSTSFYSNMHFCFKEGGDSRQ